jgi:3-phenylpropionate/trans-cinnamate dioxygenase ferredoxin reductase subunit
VNDRAFVIVGASLAGATAAAALREEGFDGRILLVGEEEALPYERPGLSKGFLRGEESEEHLLVRPPGWYEEHAVELRLGTRAVGLDPRERVLELADGQTIGFEAALIATGARNRSIPVPGADRDGVLQLRTLADAQAIRRLAARVGSAVIVGMGFIGAEVSASLRALGVEVEAVEPFEAPMYRALGPEVGGVVAAIHADHGVRMHMGESVERFDGDGDLVRVVTASGAQLAAPFAVVGVGVRPNAELWSLAHADDGGIPVGPTLETEVPGIFAAGDVASHDHPYFGRIRVEHFDNAIKMGETAARNMLGAGVVFDDPHWFWSDQYDVQIQTVGFEPPDATIVTRGSLEERSFCRFALDREGVLRAATSVSWPRDVRRAIALVRAQARPDPAALADPDLDIRKLLAEGG